MCENYVVIDYMLNTNNFEHLEYVVELHLVDSVPSSWYSGAWCYTRRRLIIKIERRFIIV